MTEVEVLGPGDFPRTKPREFKTVAQTALAELLPNARVEDVLLQAETAQAELTVRAALIPAPQLQRLIAAAVSQRTGWNCVLSFEAAEETGELALAQVAPRGSPFALALGGSSAGMAMLDAAGIRVPRMSAATMVGQGLLSESVVSVLVKYAPFSAFGTQARERLVTAITNVQAGEPEAEAVRSARQLHQAMESLIAKNPGASGLGMALAWLILDSGWKSHSARLREVGYELLQTFDPELARACKLCGGTDDSRLLEGFGELLARVRGLAAALSNPAHEDASSEANDAAYQVVTLVGNLALREMQSLVSRPTLPAAVRSHCTEAIATLFQEELMRADPSQPAPFLGLLQRCDAVGRDLVRGFVPRIDIRDYTPQELQAQRVVLGAGCYMWSGADAGRPFFDELATLVNGLPPQLRINVVWAMKFGVGESPKRLTTVVDEALPLAALNELRIQGEALGILKTMGIRTLEALALEDAKRMRKAGPALRQNLVHEVVLPLHAAGTVGDSALKLLSIELEDEAFVPRAATLHQFP